MKKQNKLEKYNSVFEKKVAEKVAKINENLESLKGKKRFTFKKRFSKKVSESKLKRSRVMKEGKKTTYTDVMVEEYIDVNLRVRGKYDVEAIVDFLNAETEYSLEELEGITDGPYGYGFTLDFGWAEVALLTDNEAYDAAEASIESLVDDMGIESFSKDFQDTILMRYVKDDWFYDAAEEHQRFYAEDIMSEGDREYGNRLVSEMIDAGLIDVDDFTDADGLFDENSASKYADLNIDDYVQYLMENVVGDPLDYFIDNFGMEEVSEMVKKNNLVKWDKVYAEAISTDGVAHFIASYDGNEINVNRKYSAYRTN